MNEPREELITIQVVGSTGNTYKTTFVVEDERLRAFCDCPAGNHGKICKHRTELLAGSREQMTDPSQEPSFERLAAIVARAPALREVASEIADAERVIQRLQATIKKRKRGFAETMTKLGFELSPDEE